jgi:hypothetical protein
LCVNTKSGINNWNRKLRPEAIQHANRNYLFFAGNLNVIQHLFPRQSKSDEDYNDRFALNLSAEPQPARIPERAEQKTGGEEAEFRASNADRAPSSDETDPSNYQLYKTPVAADPDDNSDLYFIGKFRHNSPSSCQLQKSATEDPSTCHCIHFYTIC